MSPLIIPLTGQQLVRDLPSIRLPVPVSKPVSGYQACRQMREQMQWIAAEYADFDRDVRTFCRMYQSGGADRPIDPAEFLKWLREHRNLSARQNDFWQCMHASMLIGRQAAVGGRSNGKRVADRTAAWTSPRLSHGERPVPFTRHFRVNALRRWAALSTPTLLDGSTRPPANVLLFLPDEEIHGAVFGLEGLALLNWLVDNEPCTLDELICGSPVSNRGELVEFCDYLEGIGLIQTDGPETAA